MGTYADTAVTVNYDPQYDSLVQAAENALQAAMSMIKVRRKIKRCWKENSKYYNGYGV